MGQIENDINRLLAHVVGRRFHLENERKARMDRVTEKLKRAAGVAARSNASLEAEADRLIAREQEFEDRKQAAFSPHHAVLDMRHREMDQLEDSLKIVSNADPLESSVDSGEQSTPVPPVSLQPGSAASIEPGH